ncbi:MAG: hypothetical protein PHV34_05575 [Verrucomicrobiae bacterium]|nr:hypothetical protein [Verrucomicrobiae bacterium]
MLTVDGQKIFAVDFHCQWFYPQCPALFLAGLSYEGFDAGVMVVPGTYRVLREAVEQSKCAFLPIRGCEYTFNWGHVVSVGCDQPMEDQSDCGKTLAGLKRLSKLVIFAHPLHPPTRGELWDKGLAPRFLEEGLLDAIELVNSHNLRRDLDLIRWYQEQMEPGRRLPITGGCDVHYLCAGQRPPSVYTPDFPPCDPADPKRNDIDGLGGVRTLVFAEECSEAAIVDAVKNCRTVVEAQGKLFGPPDLVRQLESGGFWEINRKELARRRQLAIRAEWRLLGGQPASLKTGAEADQYPVSVKFQGKTILFREKAFSLDMPALPDDCDEQWLPVTVSAADGQSLTSAVRVEQSLRVDFFGCRDAANDSSVICCKLFNRGKTPAGGTISASLEGKGAAVTRTFEGVAAESASTVCLPMKVEDSFDLARMAALEVWMESFGVRKLSGPVTFVGCHYCREIRPSDWGQAETIRMDRRDLVGLGNWNGPDDLSAGIKLLWNEKGLHLRALVRDDIHEQPYHGGEVYQGDCIQIGIDAFMERGGTQAPMYEFLAAMTPTGPELFCTIVPSLADEKRTVRSNALLPRECIQAAPSDGAVLYELRVPWEWLSPCRPVEGTRMGMFILLFDNDGPQHEVASGAKSVMTWPVARVMGWKAGTKHWAALTLLGEGTAE